MLYKVLRKMKYFLVINEKGFVVDFVENNIDPEATKQNALKILEGNGEKITTESAVKTARENPIYFKFLVNTSHTVEEVDFETFNEVLKNIKLGKRVKRKIKK